MSTDHDLQYFSKEGFAKLSKNLRTGKLKCAKRLLNALSTRKAWGIFLKIPSIRKQKSRRCLMNRILRNLKQRFDEPLWSRKIQRRTRCKSGPGLISNR